MVNISKLYCGLPSQSDPLRYAHAAPPATPDVPTPTRRPVVVWNITKRCNLRCVHCYTDSTNQPADDELTTKQALAVIDDLADFAVPAILLSGGEPTIRQDLFHLAEYAVAKGLRLTLSTNGTLIDETMAATIRRIGFTYVGVSLDGIGQVNDRFRGFPGAFDRALNGIRLCKTVGQRVGLRMTLTDSNINQLQAIFDLVEAERIDRICFYHLVYSGRGSRIRDTDLTAARTRQAITYICERTRRIINAGTPLEVLTVDNHADGPFVLLKLQQEGSPLAHEAQTLLRHHRGALSGSGVGIGNIDFHGHVHPDQFWMHYSLGDVRLRPFSQIWQDESDPLLAGLRNRASRIHGRCRCCRFWPICGGALRVRADLTTNDPWSPDPACYLTDQETQHP